MWQPWLIKPERRWKARPAGWKGSKRTTRVVSVCGAHFLWRALIQSRLIFLPPPSFYSKETLRLMEPDVFISSGPFQPVVFVNRAGRHLSLSALFSRLCHLSLPSVHFCLLSSHTLLAILSSYPVGQQGPGCFFCCFVFFLEYQNQSRILRTATHNYCQRHFIVFTINSSFAPWNVKTIIGVAHHHFFF